MARQREATAAFHADYARCAGIGLARIRLGHILTAEGLNVLRLSEWFLEPLRAKTRITPFARLMADTAPA